MAVAVQLLALVLGEGVPHQIAGEIGRGGKAQKAPDSAFPGKGRQQHDPAAHGRADQDLVADRQFVERRHGVGRPLADGAFFENPGRLPVSGIVEAQKGAALGPAMGLQRQRLAPGHIRFETCQKHDAGRLASQSVVGNSPAVTAFQDLRRSVGCTI